MLVPLVPKVILKQEESKTETKSGILLQEGKESDIAIVQESSIPHLKKGDRVIYARYAPDEVEFQGEKYLIADEKDILAIVDEEEKL